MFLLFMVSNSGNINVKVDNTNNNLNDYFPKGYTAKQMQDIIEKLLKQYKQRWKNRNLGR